MSEPIIAASWVAGSDIPNLREIHARHAELCGPPRTPTFDEFCSAYRVPADVREQIVERLADELW